MCTKRSMLITNPKQGDVDNGQHEQRKGALSLNLNRFQTEGTNVYDFGSYVKVHTVDTETRTDRHGVKRNGRLEQDGNDNPSTRTLMGPTGSGKRGLIIEP